jgi:hypothetical protein
MARAEHPALGFRWGAPDEHPAGISNQEMLAAWSYTDWARLCAFTQRPPSLTEYRAQLDANWPEDASSPDDA